MLCHPVVSAAHTSHPTTRTAAWLAISVTFAGVLLGCSPALAQDATGEGSTNSLRSGAWALEFDVQPSLSGYYGAAGVAAKRHLTTRSALRFGFLVAINHSDGEGTRHVDMAFPYDTTLTTTRIENDSDRRDVSLFLHFVRYLGVGDRFGIFLEAGPTVRWKSEEYGSVDTYQGATYRYAGDRDSWNYGLDTDVGFEWLFSRRLSLAGRYGISALLTDTDYTDAYDFYNPNDGYWDHRLDIVHSDGFNVQTTPAVISLTAYF